MTAVNDNVSKINTNEWDIHTASLSPRLQNDSDQIDSSQWRCIRACKRFRRRLRADRVFKAKVYYSACIYFAFFVIGWIKGQFGPSFPDLRLICDVDIEKGSWIVTTFYIGYTFGSVLEGFLYNKVNRKILFCACLSILAAMVAVIPWCFRFEAMVAAHFVQGAMEGVLDPGGNAEILRIWGTKGGRTAILGMNFASSVGSVISPLATAPFLAKRHKNNTMSDIQTDVSDPVYHDNTSGPENGYLYLEFERNSSNQIHVEESYPVTMLYIAFSLTAIVSFTTALTFLLLNLFMPETASGKGELKSMEDSPRKKLVRPLPQRMKIISLLAIAASLFTFNAIDEAFIAYLSTFCVTFFNWTSSSGALVTSLLFISNLSTRLVYLVVSKWLNTLVCVGIHGFAIFIALLGFLVISLHTYDTGVWIFVPLFGYGKAVLFALLFSWTNEYLTPMTGEISSAFFISAMVGSSLNPLLLGYLMKQVATIWFGYLFAIEGAVLVFLYVIGLILTKYITRQYGGVFKMKEEENDEYSTRL